MAVFVLEFVGRRGGNRRLNRALHVTAITRGLWDPTTKAYLNRKEAEGKTRMEAPRWRPSSR